MNRNFGKFTLWLCLSIFVAACDSYVIVASRYQASYMALFSGQDSLGEFDNISQKIERFVRIDGEKMGRHCKTNNAETTKTIDCGRRTVLVSKQGTNVEIKIITTVFLPREKIEKDEEEKFSAELLQYVTAHTGVKFYPYKTDHLTHADRSSS